MNETLSIEEAKAIIEPFYDLFRHDKRDWEKGFAVLDDAWRSYYTTTEYRTKQETQPYIEGLFDMVPDIYVDIKDMHLAGDVVAVRSELSGTPKADFMVPHSGQSFKIMTIDLNRIKDGKIVELYHLEDWGTAIKQLSAKE